MSQGLFKRFFLTGVVTAFAFALAACSDETEQAGEDGGEDVDAEGEEEEAEADWEPTEAIQYIAPSGAGGGWDTLARTSATVLEENELTPQPMPVENVEGGGGAVGWAQIASNEGDPHHMFAASPPLILIPLDGESEYDHNDFTPLARLITDYSVIIVDDDSEYETIHDLMDDIEEDPEDVAIAGGSAPGSMDHISMAGAADAAGIDASQLNYVAFAGGGEVITNVMGGQVDAGITGAGEASGSIQGGDVRALAVSSEEPIDSLPEVPTLVDEGIDYTFDIWRGVLAPGDIPEESVRYYEEMFADMIETEEWQEATEDLGWIDAYQDSEEFGEFLDEQAMEFEEILDDLGLLGQ
ncbi:Bug family tripartite tricarboxylate transporter substrate binding protein [Salicibibacter kimchii]|uniref:Tripartite tricarboxylate transporter substrate binding protein n=1 Tax=Salicibibacter kimchii TaxID=2099786 RepID=A0A345BXM7_9BACI|nr:tripartite tricarboxylate transporter substrate binding protein [Salicibibacter kimchii]AXF55708.1 tripartite tricarboxylate transporter substrate binding protein [Salicibibacter kimchii]